MLSVLDQAMQVRRRRGAADFERQQSHFVLNKMVWHKQLNGYGND